MHARTLAMLSELLLLERGGDLFGRDGHVLGDGDVLHQPGLVQTLEALADEGAASVYRGSIAEALLQIDGLVLSGGRPRELSRSLARIHARRLRGPARRNSRRALGRPGAASSPPTTRRPDRGPSACSRSSRPSSRNRTGGEHTTNMVAVDGHGRACVLTHSLGVGAGVWLPGFDVQLNNLLGESDIVSGDPQRGDHLESRMAPSLVFDDNGLELAIGSAGATRLRTALAAVLAAILDERLDAETAVALPRVHPTLDLVDAEPGVDESALAVLEESGRTVRRWDRLHHYFGGVSCVGRAGAAGDPRRSGAAVSL